MSYKKLQKSIEKDIEMHSGQSSQLKIRQYKSSLNYVIKNNLCDKNDIKFYLTEGIEDLKNKYRALLKEQNAADQKSPISRLVNLSKYYVEIEYFDVENLAFSEVLQKALRRKYGKKLYEGEVTNTNRSEINASYMTYRSIGRAIVEKGIIEHPELWPGVSPGDNKRINTYAGYIRDWIAGDVTPTAKVTNGRFSFIEKFLDIEDGILLEKIKLTSRFKLTQANKKLHKKPKIIKAAKSYQVKKLNKNFQTFYENYSNYRINGKQPEISNVTEKMKNEKYYKIKYKVKEMSRGKERRWTIGGGGKSASLVKFHSEMKAFINHCVLIEKMDEEEVALYHLTDPEILENLVHNDSEHKCGASTILGILNLVSVSIQKKGYLRLCGDIGDRSMDEYFEDIDFIEDQIYDWKIDARGMINEKGKGAAKGKENIEFLLKLKVKERIAVSDLAINYLVEKSKAGLLEAETCIKRYEQRNDGANKVKSRKKKAMSQACTYIKRAYGEALTAFIYSVSFKVCPRLTNWMMLNHYSDVSKRDSRFPSLCLDKKKNRYDLLIPLEGPNLMSDEQEDTRYIKNSESRDCVAIEMLLPEKYTEVINVFLAARQKYIDYEIPYTLPRLIERNTNMIEEINASSSLKEYIKKSLIGELEKDIDAFENYEIDKSRVLLIWASQTRSYSEISNEELEGMVNAPGWTTSKMAARKLYFNEASLGAKFKMYTLEAFKVVAPDLEQYGINIHAMRSLSVITFLQRHGSDYEGASGIINDDEEQIYKTYGNQDRTKTQKRLSEMDD